jgi:hypothetical protein
MKRLFSVCLLIICLSFPVLAGHSQPGDFPCSCGSPGCVQDYPCECCTKPVSSGKAPSDSTAELGIALVAILLWLRLKA